MTAELLKNYGSSCNVFSHKNIITSGFKAVLCFTLQGASPTTIILVVPLFFGVCHLHHARELLLVHRQPLEHVLAMVGVEQQHRYAELHHTLTAVISLVLTGPAADGVVLERGYSTWSVVTTVTMHTSLTIQVCFQLLYTTVFGWYATWIFLKFGSYIPAVVVHAFCNWMGVPAFRAMAADDRAKALYATTAVGMVSFAVGLSMLTAQVGNRYLSVAEPRSKG